MAVAIPAPVCWLGSVCKQWPGLCQRYAPDLVVCSAVCLQSVLRRLRAFQCLDVLQSTISPIMTGNVDAQQLPLQEFASLVGKAASAAGDLATLVLQPAHSKHTFLWDKVDIQAEGSSVLQQPQQEADYCVLQLMLSSRTLDLLAGLSSHIGVHMHRLPQQQSAGELQPSQAVLADMNGIGSTRAYSMSCSANSTTFRRQLQVLATL